MPSYPSRCQRIKIDGTQCGSPALRRNRFCYFHKRHHDERIELHADRQKNARARRRTVAIDLPVFEDANSIQVSLMQITRLLIAGDIDAKTAGLVLYALQTASSNLHRTRFEPRMHDVILDPASVGETALGAHAWDDSDFANEEDDDENGEPDDGIDPNRRAGIMKAAEYLYELDCKNGGIHGFAPKPVPTPPKSDSKTKNDPRKKPDPTSDPKLRKAPAREANVAKVREQIRQQIVNAAPALLAANPSLILRQSKESPRSSP
jgi:hypothetical protein